MIETLQNGLLSLIFKPSAAVGLCFLLLLGLATLTSSILALLDFVSIYFLRPGKNLRRLGDWAAITGATDGIGKAYAEALAKKGDPHVPLDPAHYPPETAPPTPTPPERPLRRRVPDVAYNTCCCASAPAAGVARRHSRCESRQTQR